VLALYFADLWFPVIQVAIYSLHSIRQMHIYDLCVSHFADLWFAATRVAGDTLDIIRHMHMHGIYIYVVYFCSLFADLHFRLRCLYICGPSSSTFAKYAIYSVLCMLMSYIRHIYLLTYSFWQPSFFNAPEVDQDKNISSSLKLAAFLCYKTLK
jgi:hypothetical protein